MKRTISHSLALSAILATSSALAGTVTVGGTGGGFVIETESLMEKRFATVIKQQYDFSCGSAALATLLTYHYEQPASEAEIFETMYKNGDKKQIVQSGFSLLDMKSLLKSFGYRADGYRISLDKLSDLGVPAIALTETDGYRHFVVVKGITQDTVLIGDPAVGLKTFRRADFELGWNGILFLIRDRAEIAQRHFNETEEWRSLSKSSYEEGNPLHTLGSFTLAMPRLNDF